MDQNRRTDFLTRLAELEREFMEVRREIAGSRPRTAVPGGTFQAVRVIVGGDEYAIQGVEVREIVRYARLTRVSGAPRVIEGAMNLRGDVVAVLNVPRRLGLDELKVDLKTPIVVVEIHGQPVGLLVDRVSDVVVLDGATLETSGAALGDAPYVAAVATVGGRLVQLLDVAVLVSRDEIQALQARLALDAGATSATSVDDDWGSQ